MSDKPLPIDWAFAQLPHPHHDESGDAYLVVSHESGVTIAVIDGLGHGPKAHAAAQAAVEVLRQYPGEHPIDLMRLCHDDHRVKRRGLVMTVAAITPQGKMTWAGVGNVKALLFRVTEGETIQREHLHLRGGTVGSHLPTIRPFERDLQPDDTLIFTTDGIQSGFSDDIHLAHSPQLIADHILANYNRGTDDALVVVARFNPHRND